jgi:4-hydroxy-L-threonine phosphate dehydrogenase PdxA
MPLVAAIASITPERIVDHLALLDETLRGWGFREPRIALAGLNPHAGEQGQLGREELDVLAPETGLTVIAGLSFLRVSPAHGTAFDIAGLGRASAKNLIVALRQAAAWSAGRPIAVAD